MVGEDSSGVAEVNTRSGDVGLDTGSGVALCRTWGRLYVIPCNCVYIVHSTTGHLQVC